MVRAFAAILTVIGFLAAGLVAPTRSAAQDGVDRLFAAFDARALPAAEARLLQIALAAGGFYRGPLDGVWSGASAAALAAHVREDYGSGDVLAIHAATLWLDFEVEAARRDWREAALDGFDLALALPRADLDPPEAEEGGTRWWSRDGGLTVLAMRHDRFDADAWHAAGREVNARPGALFVRRDPDRMVTAGELADGRAFHSQSERIGDGWSTVFVAVDEAERPALSLIAASIHAGAARDWAMPATGPLADLVALTRRLLVDLGPDPADGAPAPPPRPLPTRAEPARTGTGFFVGPRTLVTAAHVVRGCARVARGDGAPLALIAADPELDLAVLGAAEPAPAWLGLAGATETRLGQRIQALGYPYFRLTGTTLNATGGNISALAGIDDDRRFLALSAPVQPGNSGGPLIGAGGTVLGVVVARLSDDFIIEATGTLPQNVNYAVTSRELVAFLRRNGADTAPGGLAGYDLDAGAPAGIERAVVPLVCD